MTKSEKIQYVIKAEKEPNNKNFVYPNAMCFNNVINAKREELQDLNSQIFNNNLVLQARPFLFHTSSIGVWRLRPRTTSCELLSSEISIEPMNTQMELKR